MRTGTFRIVYAHAQAQAQGRRTCPLSPWVTLRGGEGGAAAAGTGACAASTTGLREVKCSAKVLPKPGIQVI